MTGILCTIGGTVTNYNNNIGVNWSTVSFAVGGVYTSIAASGNTWIAVTSLNSYVVARSADNGATWSEITLPAVSDWNSVAASGTNIWVAVAAGTNKGARSTDNGATWSEITLPASQTWTSTATNGSAFVTVGNATNLAARSVS